MYQGEIMNFKRARNELNKQHRYKDIQSAAIELLNSHAYVDITLSSIGKHVSFSRANLYTYALTKEEIYLSILKEDIHLITLEMLTLEDIKDIDTFIDHYIQIIIKHPLYLKLGSIMSTIIEVNVSEKVLIDFKLFLLETKRQFDLVIKKLLQKIDGLNQDLIFTYFHTVSTSLYANMYANENQIQLYRLMNYPYQMDQYPQILSVYLKTFMKGLV
jgi:AcrR family transcriptional regulator